MVPLHEHMIEQGFLAFVNANGKGPLFYNEPTQPAASNDPTNPRKPCFVKARGRVGPEPWRQRSGVVTQPRMAPYVQGCRLPLWHVRKGARRHCRPRACFGRTRLRRADACGLALEGLRDKLDAMAPLVRKVMKQTRARILRGDTRSDGKLVSMFEPATEIIPRARLASRPNSARW